VRQPPKEEEEPACQHHAKTENEEGEGEGGIKSTCNFNSKLTPRTRL